MSFIIQNPPLMFLSLPLAALIVVLIVTDFVRFRDRTEWKAYKRRVIRLRSFMMITRILMIALLVIALASPSVLKEKVIQSDPSLLILVDSSRSFDLFDRAAADRL